MTMQISRSEVANAVPVKPAFAVRAGAGAKAVGKSFVENVLPPLVVVALLLIVWQIAFDRPGATLPAPTKIWAEASDLILDPSSSRARRTSGSAGAC